MPSHVREAGNYSPMVNQIDAGLGFTGEFVTSHWTPLSPASPIAAEELKEMSKKRLLCRQAGISVLDKYYSLTGEITVTAAQIVGWVN